MKRQPCPFCNSEDCEILCDDNPRPGFGMTLTTGERIAFIVICNTCGAVGPVAENAIKAVQLWECAERTNQTTFPLEPIQS